MLCFALVLWCCVVLCYVMFKGDWMVIKLYSVLNYLLFILFTVCFALLFCPIVVLC